MRLPVTSFTISLNPNSNTHLQCYNDEAVDIFDEQPQGGGGFKVLYHILSLTTSRQEDTRPSAEMESEHPSTDATIIRYRIAQEFRGSKFSRILRILRHS